MSKREQALYDSFENETRLEHVWFAAAKSLYDYRLWFNGALMPSVPISLYPAFDAFRREQSALQ